MELQDMLVTTQCLEESMTCQGTEVLKYIIEYPVFHSECYCNTARAMSTYYYRQALRLQSEYRRNLFQQAVQQYRYDLANGNPIMAYQAQVDYHVTYHQDGLLSLYQDRYTYTGGAHGNTLRCSNTWSLRNARLLPMHDFFVCGGNYRCTIINNVIGQIEHRNQEQPGLFFDDYEKLVRQTFREENYYLVPQGMMVYFQQYDIAPYSTGIPEFLLRCTDF